MNIKTKLNVTKLKHGDKLIDSEMRQHTYIAQSERWVFTVHKTDYNGEGEYEYTNTWRKTDLSCPMSFPECFLFDYAGNITDDFIKQKRKSNKLKMFNNISEKETLLQEYKDLIENDKVEL